MKNFEKYKTAEERVDAFFKHRHSSWTLKEAFVWLDLEAEDEKPLPCPFCGGECGTTEHSESYSVHCTSCFYNSGKGNFFTKEDAIAAHNRVARAVKESEAK